MIRTILVPLDGSPLAEHAVPYARRIALLSGARLVLLRVLDERTTAYAAQSYLADQVNTLNASGVQVETVVEDGDAAKQILAHIDSLGATIVAMGTHGRSAPGRWIYGSVADAVLRHSPVPVLLVPSDATRPWPEQRPPRILVPLDDSQFSEAALASAVDLAKQIQGEIVLLQVVPWPPYVYGDGADLLALDPMELSAIARDYLEDVATHIRPDLPGGVRVQVELARPPAAVIAQTADHEHSDLIVMATHGRSGLARMVLGSVALGTVQRAGVPLLLVRPTMLATASAAEEAAAEVR